MSKVSDPLLGQQPVAKPLPWWQKRMVTISVALFGLIIIIAIMTMNVAKYETHLTTGDTVLLALAPVDPRGFMQGDYMTLSYALERDILNTLEKARDLDKAADGYVIVRLDKHNVGRFVRLADSYQPDILAADEKAIHYRLRNGSVKLATNAFFFQEGHAEAFEAAEYGLFRVNDNGEPLLTDMVDGAFNMIEPDVKSAENQVVQNNP